MASGLTRVQASPTAGRVLFSPICNTPATNRIREIKPGSVQAAIWQNGLEYGRVMYSVSFSRLYEDDVVWHDATSFGRSEFPLLARAAKMALDWTYAQPGGENPKTGEE